MAWDGIVSESLYAGGGAALVLGPAFLLGWLNNNGFDALIPDGGAALYLILVVILELLLGLIGGTVLVLRD